MQICVLCNINLDFNCFYFRKDSNKYRNECKSCFNKKGLDRYFKNRDIELKRRRNDYNKNRERYLRGFKLYRDSHIEEMAEYKKNWKKRNRYRANFCESKREATKLNATPKWLTDEDFLRIKCFYLLASFLTKKFGIMIHVDHIIPLQGKSVRGLHVPWNLQLLLATDNIKKGNRY